MIDPVGPAPRAPIAARASGVLLKDGDAARHPGPAALMRTPLLPDLDTDDAFQRLVDDLRTHGQTATQWHAVLVRGGELMSPAGIAPLSACAALGLVPRVRDMTPPDWRDGHDATPGPGRSHLVVLPSQFTPRDLTPEEAVRFMQQYLTTRYTKSQRAIFAVPFVNTDKRLGWQRREGVADPRAVTAIDIAPRLGVHATSVREAQRCRRQGVRAVVDALRTGQAAISSVYDLVTLPKAEQAERLADLTAFKPGGQPRGLYTRNKHRRYADSRQFDGALDKLEVVTEVLTASAAGVAPADRGAAAKRLRALRTEVTRALRTLESDAPDDAPDPLELDPLDPLDTL